MVSLTFSLSLSPFVGSARPLLSSLNLLLLLLLLLLMLEEEWRRECFLLGTTRKGSTLVLAVNGEREEIEDGGGVKPRPP